MNSKISIKNIINPFNKKIVIDGDKSLSIRWALLSISSGKSTSYNLLKSEDVLNTLRSLKNLVKVYMFKKSAWLKVGVNGYKYKKYYT